MKRKLTTFKYILEFSILAIVFTFISSSSGQATEMIISNENMNKSVNLSTMALFINKEEEKRINEEAIQTYLWGSLDSYTGDLTGYGADCSAPGCTGRLACMSSLDISNGKNTYVDKTYGEINIVASSKNLPCGTIIRFDSKRISENPIVAIVLDRGVLGNDIDFLTPSEEYAGKYIGRSSITYDVLRFGWEK